MSKKLDFHTQKNADSKDTFPASHILPVLQDWVASDEVYGMALHGVVSQDLT